MSISTAAFAQDDSLWSEGFEEGGSTEAKAYQKGEPRSSVEIVRIKDASDGQAVLRVHTPGEADIEGATWQVLGLSLVAGQQIELTAKVRGEGRISPSVLAHRKWRYTKQPVTLSSQWQHISVKHKLSEDIDRVRLCFATTEKQTDGVKLELDDVRLCLVPSDEAMKAGDGSVMQAAYCPLPPVIDGQADDACWDQAGATAVDFLTFGHFMPAQAQTAVRLCFDQHNLYVLFHCDEPVLEAAAQRQHELVAERSEHDADIYRDASCAVLIQPNGEGAVYEIGANALGTVLDARCDDPANLWESRDLDWDSHTKAATRLGDGVWTLELAIPLQALGISTPQAGAHWGLGVARLAPKRREFSSWHRSGAGLHDPQPLGHVAWSKKSTAVTVETPAMLETGPNVLRADFPAGVPEPGVYLWTAVQGPRQDEARNQCTFIKAGQNSIEHVFEVDVKGTEAAVTYGLLSAGSQEDLYRSATTKRSVRGGGASLVFTTAAEYELWIGDRKIDAGVSADHKSIDLPLREGINDITLRLAAGSAELRLNNQGLWGHEPVWQYRAWDPDAPNETETAAWQRDAGEPDGQGELRRYGHDAGPTELRHTVLWNGPRLWPEPQVHLARGSAQHLTFRVDGVKGRQLHDWAAYVALPAGVEALGSTGYYGETAGLKPFFELEPVSMRTIDGQSMQVVKITADKPVRRNKNSVLSLFHVMVRADEEASFDNFDNEEAPIYYWSVAEGASITEPAQRGTLRLLPALRGQAPEKIIIEVWGGYFGAIDNHDLARATLETAKAAGVNTFVASDKRHVRELVDEVGLGDMKMVVDFLPHSINLQPYLAEHPDDRLINVEGKPSSAVACTTLLVSDVWPTVADLLTQLIDEVQPSIVEFDYEYSVFGGPYACYCDRCFSAFRDHAGLSASESLSPATIEKDHADAWTDYMTTRSTELFKLMRQAVHASDVEARFSVYSGYQCTRTKQRYGVDWKKVAEQQAVDIGGFGYGRPVEYIQATHEVLGQDIQSVFGAIVRPCRPHRNNSPHQVNAAQLLRRAIDARGGVLVFDRLAMDGRSWYAIAEASRLIAQHEALFYSGQRQDAPGLPESEAVVLTGDDGSALLVLMNGSKHARTFEVRLPDGFVSAQGFYSQDTKQGTQRTKLAPGEAEAFVLQR